MNKPIYVSKSTVKSLWQEYRIYNDHLEFDTLVGKMEIPFSEIESYQLSNSDLGDLLKGDLKMNNFKPALKLDWANFLEHIVIDKSEGYVHRILFTPDNPEEFISELNNAITNFKNNSHNF